MVKLLNEKIKKIIAVSSTTKEILSKAGIKENKIIVCYNSVNIKNIESRNNILNSELPNTSKDEIVFLLPAVIQPAKGQLLALKAFSSIINKGLKAQLWFAGDTSSSEGDKYKDILGKKINDLSLNNFIHSLGWRDDIYGVMEKSDVIFLNSLGCESFGMVLAEAMALEKPCIGPKLGGVPEVIENGKTGEIFPEGDYKSLASKMIKLIENKNLIKTFGLAGKQRVNNIFSIESQIKCIRKVLDYTEEK